MACGVEFARVIFGIQTAVQLIAHLGVRWPLFRALYYIKRRTGALRRATPLATWTRVPCFELNPLSIFGGTPAVSEKALGEAREICAGKFQLFSWKVVDAGALPNWSQNQLTGEHASTARHWSDLGDFAFGDIKGVWELSRFRWAVTLARGYAMTRDQAYADRFWNLFEDWLDKNPPNRGPNWMCGQEAAFRLMASCFVLDVLRDNDSLTKDRKEKFSRFVFATGSRIRANIKYALSQSNNHGISECVGLITASVVLPDSPQSVEWRKMGVKALKSQVSELVYPDGGFSQHSAIYHRVLLHDLIWCIAVLRAKGCETPMWLISAATRALDFAATLTNLETGEVPLYGPSDGANVLPLADSEYLDFRPTLQAGFQLLYGTRLLPCGPWDEMADWFARVPSLCRKLPSESGQTSRPLTNILHFPAAGVVIGHFGDFRPIMRCPTKFRHRPTEADMLHMDVEWKGVKVAHDGGTYSYNCTGVFETAFKKASSHNSITFDGMEPLQQVTRFLYLPWPKGSVTWAIDGASFSATHDGWKRVGATHKRTILYENDRLIIRDALQSRATRRARLHWALKDVSYEFNDRNVVLHTDEGHLSVSWHCPSATTASIVRASETSDRGWWSPGYCRIMPALSLAIDFEFSGSIEIVSVFAPARIPL